jgi:hypothetical protein
LVVDSDEWTAPEGIRRHPISAEIERWLEMLHALQTKLEHGDP